ncbi:MAG: discoidin domain-containing protein [Lachnospiraceae bacterium]|nr:discoidin domain-containing protein [Lachnospiraceae bacterium]
MKKSTKTILASVLAMAMAVSPMVFEGTDKTEAATMVTVNYATNAVVTTSSNENAEYTGDKAADGDMTTRWSSVFADNQWIMFDIGSVKTVGTVDIFWEAAYASRYTISWSQDNVTWYDAVITGTHGAGEAVHMFNKPARYVKITANQRGTSYGVSIFEVKLIGSEMVEETTTVEETTVAQPETTTADATVWESIGNSSNLFYQHSNVINVVNYQQPGFAAEAGIYMTVPSAVTSVSVNGNETNVAAIQGAGAVVYGSAFTQTVNDVVLHYATGVALIKVKNTTATEVTSEEATTEAPTEEVTTEAPTESETVASGTNLASLPSARAYASSEENASLSAANAIDGDMSTRWSSAWRNGESITVDLGKIYLVGTVTIFWEDAYASQYTISWSQDGVTWYDAVTMGNSRPGECVNWFLKPARYVKVTADKRGTQYGASIYELRLIGEEYTGQTYTRG